MSWREARYFFKNKRTIVCIGAVKVDSIFPVLQVSHSQLDILSPELSFPAYSFAGVRNVVRQIFIWKSIILYFDDDHVIYNRRYLHSRRVEMGHTGICIWMANTKSGWVRWLLLNSEGRSKGGWLRILTNNNCKFSDFYTSRQFTGTTAYCRFRQGWKGTNKCLE